MSAAIISSTVRRPQQDFRQVGFTLLELLVVMVIIGLLASYVAPRYFGEIGKSETKVAKAQIDALSKAVVAFRLDTGHFPSTAQGLQALTIRPEGETHWAGPYLSRALPNDPWGRPYIYKCPGDDSRDYEISTLGKDGQPGGTDENADIKSWE